MTKGRKLTFTEAQIKQIKLLAASGVRAKEISKRIGRHYKAVWQLMKRMRIKGQGRYHFPKADLNPSWNNGRYIDCEGYVHVRCDGHPNAHGKGYVLEHRRVMEQHIGRLLLPGEVVHHKDGNKANNAIENLELFDCNAEHLKHELTGRCPKWTPEGVRAIREANMRRIQRLAS